MRVPDRLERLVPPAAHRVPVWTRVLAVPVVAALMAVGIWVTGGVLTNDFTGAQLLTGGFLALAGAAALVVGLRWRDLALPVLVTYALTAGVLGGYLVVSSTRNVTVHEQVVTVDDDAPRAQQSTAAMGRVGMRTSPVAVARGSFRSLEHDTTGTARIIKLVDDSHVLTLTDLDTDPGPDLRVYLVRGDGDSVRDHVDLGALKGNRGTQQYAIPASARVADYGAVVIWCRAFSVAFGAASFDT